MGFENYDLIWKDLETVMQKYGYQIVTLRNDGDTAESRDDVIRATFVKEIKEGRIKNDLRRV